MNMEQLYFSYSQLWIKPNTIAHNYLQLAENQSNNIEAGFVVRLCVNVFIS